MKKIKYVEAQELIPEVKQRISQANLISDVGCGIRPQTLAPTFIHVCVDAHKQYLDVLQKGVKKNNQIKGVLKYLCLNKTTYNIVDDFPEKIVDSIFLLDVIEHLDKLHGIELINSFTKIARHQIIIFTPLGFIKQEHPDGKDAWGLDGGKWQEHRSGWTPDDFDESWEFIVCKNFHQSNNMGYKLEEPFGGFFAIKTMGVKPKLIAESNIFRKGLFWLKSFRLFKKLQRTNFN